MALKETESLSRADFDAAVVRLRLNVSEIAKEVGIPRTYLSEFRNGDRKLRPENLAKLRDYFESKGIEFDSNPDPDAPPAPPAGPPHDSLAVSSVCHFPVRLDLDRAAVRDILKEVDRNDARIGELFAKKASRIAGESGEDPQGFEAETDSDLRELFALLGANYVFFRYLTGVKNPLDASGGADSLHGVVIDTIRESLARAGIEPAGAEAGPAPAPKPEENQPPLAKKKMFPTLLDDNDSAHDHEEAA